MKWDRHSRHGIAVGPFMGAIAISVIGLAGLGWTGFHAHQLAKASVESRASLERTAGELVHLDEALTMSARMAAATGDPGWEKRYRRLEPRLHAARGPNRQGSELEHRALSLARSGQGPAASLLVLSDAYEAQKKSYARDIAQHFNRVRGKLNADLRTDRRNVIYALIATGLAMVFSLALWIILFVRASNRRVALESAIGSISQSASDELAAQDRSRELLDRATVGIQIADRDGKRLFVNQALADLMGYDSPAELLAEKPAALVASEDMPRLLEIRAHHFRGEAAPTTYEFVGIRKDRSRIPIQVVTSLVTWQGEPAIQRTFIDLTARKQAEEALKISEANLSAAQRLTGVGSWEANLEKHQIRYSRELCRILNVDSEAGMLSYDEFLERVHPDDREAVDKRNNHALKTGEQIDHRYRIVQSDGTIRHVHSMAEVFFDHLGTPVRVTGALQDITERVLAEEALRESEANLAEAQRIARVGSWVSDRRTGEIRFSDELNRMLGIDPETYEYTPDSFMKLVHPDDREQVLAFREELKAGQGDRDIVFRIVRPEGEVRYIHSREKAFFDEDGKLLRIAGTRQDITERIRTEEALRESEERYRQLIDLTPEAVFVQCDGANVFANRAAAEILGADTPESLIGLSTTDYIHPDCLTALHKRHEQLLDSDRPLPFREFIYMRLDGAEVTVESAIAPMSWQGRPATLVVAHDITERKQAEEALRASELRMSRMLDITPEAVIAIDSDHRIELFNQAAEDVFGYSADEMVGQPLDVLLPADAKKSHHKFIGRFAKSSEPSRLMSRRGELVGVKKDGTEFPATASISKMELGGDMIFTAIFHDISNRKSAEMTMFAAMEEAKVANRAKSEFLANMSHEFRTPLNAIIGFSEVMTNETFGRIGNARYREYIQDIHYSAGHLRDLITDILDLSKVESGMDELYEENVDIPVLVNAILRLVRQRADEHGIDLSLEIVEELPALRADQRKLKQILVNLLSNAVKFTPSGGKVSLRAWCNESSGHVFQIIDTGIGIASDDIPKVLTQFGQADGAFNRKKEGTGLGLPLTKSLIELHGGSFDLQSEIGLGTTVTARFPARRIVRAPDSPKDQAAGGKAAS